MEKPLYLVKIGGSVITDTNRPQVAKRDEIVRLFREISSARLEGKFNVIIGHGSGSFGHTVAKQYKVNEGMVDETSRRGAALTKIAAMDLNRIVLEVGVGMGIPVFPFSASSFSFAKERMLQDGTVEGIRHALEGGFVPVVHGDVVMDSKLGASIASTEEVFRFLSGRIRPAKIVLGTDVDGVFDKDPTKHKDAKLVHLVNGENYRTVLSSAAGAKKVDVTGGMRSKLELLYGVVHETGATGYIMNAAAHGAMRKVLVGDPAAVCTVVTK